jgi:hypothetical protein
MSLIITLVQESMKRKREERIPPSLIRCMNVVFHDGAMDWVLYRAGTFIAVPKGDRSRQFMTELFSGMLNLYGSVVRDHKVVRLDSCFPLDYVYLVEYRCSKSDMFFGRTEMIFGNIIVSTKPMKLDKVSQVGLGNRARDLDSLSVDFTSKDVDITEETSQINILTL